MGHELVDQRCREEDLVARGVLMDAPRWLAWEDGTIPRLAKHVYDNDDWEVLPRLADALEDAGCRDRMLLEHLRRDYSDPSGGGNKGRSSHVRGCWALDLILGKG